MRLLTILLFCFLTVSGFAQDAELKQIESVLKICASVDSQPDDSNHLNLGHLLSTPENELLTSSLNLSANINLDFQAGMGQKFQTYAVRIDFLEGYKYHVAEYYDGTCIVTCLDGPLLGYQVISVHGVITAESSKVNWRRDHFVHRYPNGKVFTYERMQIIELK